MKPVLIVESGISFWESGRLPRRDTWTTLSLVASSRLDLLAPLNAVLGAVASQLMWLRWHTQLEPFEGNLLQKLKFEETLRKPLGRFAPSVVTKADDIWTSVARLELPLAEQEFNILTDYRRNLLIGISANSVKPDDILSFMTVYSGGYDAPGLAETRRAFGDVVFGRAYEDSDTHCAFQFILAERHTQWIEREVASLEIERLRSRDDLVGLLRGSSD